MSNLKETKVLAINLPAFHQVPENDEWWGEGFTEWDNVKSGKKLFKHHYQPREPHMGYYDLSKKEDIENQMRTAAEYGVHGFIYYHYWFGNGRMIFEKPLEIIKNEIDFDFNYCFCWANETWITTWHGLPSRTLLEQKYDGKADWEKHLEYLMPFFKDNRYIKVDNKPMMYIYKPNEIPDYDQMVDFFDAELKKNGFDGIYFVEYIYTKNKDLSSDKSSAVMEFEPLYTTFFDISKFNLAKRFICKKLKIVDYQNYKKLWKYKLKRTRRYNGKNIQKSCFVDWDNSSRKGKDSMIVKGATADLFKKYLHELVKQDRADCDNEFLVINAWNEWSEGAYLEPDKKFKYGYLEAIKSLTQKGENG